MSGSFGGVVPRRRHSGWTSGRFESTKPRVRLSKYLGVSQHGRAFDSSITLGFGDVRSVSSLDSGIGFIEDGISNQRKAESLKDRQSFFRDRDHAVDGRVADAIETRA